jgi:erythromycin esterase
MMSVGLNAHVSKTPEGRSPGGISPGPYMGYHLKQRLGDRYYAMGFEFYQGAYQTRVWPENGPPADLKEGILPPAPAGSTPSYFAHAGVGNVILDLRAPVASPVVEQWLSAPQVFHHIAWAYQEPSDVYTKMAPRTDYDGILFIESTTATRPTQNALRTVSSRKGV